MEFLAVFLLVITPVLVVISSYILYEKKDNIDDMRELLNRVRDLHNKHMELHKYLHEKLPDISNDVITRGDKCVCLLETTLMRKIDSISEVFERNYVPEPARIDKKNK